MRALITITHRTVEHNDPEAAGFVNGYWWTLTDDSPFGYVESASASAEVSEEFARGIAHSRGYTDDEVTVVIDGKLLKRKGDEARVVALIAENLPT